MKLSIIIIEYFCLDELSRCVDSVGRAFSVDKEIIISSNSCYPLDQRKKLESLFPSDDSCTVKWCFNERNCGFAYAMNKGLSLATGDFLTICNPDCVFTENLDDICLFLSEHPEVGAAAPKMVDKDGNIQDTARDYVSLPAFVWRQLRRIFTKKDVLLCRTIDYNKVQTVDFLIGAFIMVSREAYEKTHGLDESYFMYAEDVDWCTRIRLCGKEVVYYPKVKLQYKGTRSARRNLKSALVFLKSHIIYWNKYGFFFGYPKRSTLKKGA